jgi:hypothetical protein
MAGGLYFLGHHHVVAGAAVGGIAVVPKANFSLAEVFVDHNSVRQLAPDEARAASPVYTALLASQDSEQIEIARMNARQAGPSMEIVAGMGVDEVESLLGKPETLHHPSEDTEVRHYGTFLVMMQHDRVVKVLR